MPDLSDILVVGARVTYMIATDNATGRAIQLGTRPHCAMWHTIPRANQCPADLNVTNEADSESFAERCTRELNHRGAHVVHVQPGLPTLAWLVDSQWPTTPVR